MKYFAIMLAALMLTAPSYAQRLDRGQHGSQARVEAHKGSDLKQEVKALRKELEALKKEVATCKKQCASLKGKSGRATRGSRGDSPVRGKRTPTKKGEKKMQGKRPDWDQIRKRMESLRKGRGSVQLNESRWQRGWMAKK